MKKESTKASRDERVKQLLLSARKVFSQKGYHAATVGDITRAAGVAKGTFYLYFDEKPAVFYQLLKGFFEMVTGVLAEATPEAVDRETFFARLRNGIASLIAVFHQERDLVRLAYRESMGLDDRVERMVRDFYRTTAEYEAANIRKGIELGILRDDIDPLLAAYAHLGGVERVLLQWTFDKRAPKVENIVEQLLSLTFEGLTVPGPK